MQFPALVPLCWVTLGSFQELLEERRGEGEAQLFLNPSGSEWTQPLGRFSAPFT
jgi:hypothetical protein